MAPRGRSYVCKPFVPFRTHQGIGGRTPNSEENLPKRIARFLFKHRNCPPATVRDPNGAGADLMPGGCKHVHELSVKDICWLLMDETGYVRRKVKRLVDEMVEKERQRKLRGMEE